MGEWQLLTWDTLLDGALVGRRKNTEKGLKNQIQEPTELNQNSEQGQEVPRFPNSTSTLHGFTSHNQTCSNQSFTLHTLFIPPQ